MSPAAISQRRSFGIVRRCRQLGFTLVELMLVMGVMVILMVLIAPALSHLLDSNNLTQGAQTLVDQINMARQMASSRNVAVEVRLLKLTKNSSIGFSAVQIWANNASGTLVAASNPAVLPQGIVISEDATVSEALTKLPTGTMPGGAGPTANAPYASFQIGPTGIVKPVIAMKPFYWVVLPARAAGGPALPKNYVTIQLNPLIATPLVYRP